MLDQIRPHGLGLCISFLAAGLGNTARAGTVSGPTTSTVGDIVTWGNTTGTLVADPGVPLASLAPLNSPAFTGTPSVTGTFSITDVLSSSSTTPALEVARTNAYSSGTGRITGTAVKIDDSWNSTVPNSGTSFYSTTTVAAPAQSSDTQFTGGHFGVSLTAAKGSGAGVRTVGGLNSAVTDTTGSKSSVAGNFVVQENDAVASGPDDSGIRLGFHILGQEQQSSSDGATSFQAAVEIGIQQEIAPPSGNDPSWIYGVHIDPGPTYGFIQYPIGVFAGYSIQAVSAAVGSSGSSFLTGDVVKVTGGTTSGNPPAEFTVTAAGGHITALTLLWGGSYDAAPGSGALALTAVTGSGTGATATVTWNATHSRQSTDGILITGEPVNSITGDPSTTGFHIDIYAAGQGRLSIGASSGEVGQTVGQLVFTGENYSTSQPPAKISYASITGNISANTASSETGFIEIFTRQSGVITAEAVINGGYVGIGAAGGGEGVGTINAVGYYANGTAGVTCSGTPTSSFSTKLGIVTHC